MIQTNTTMTLDYFNDFYVIQALSAKINNRIAQNPELAFSHSVERLQNDIKMFALQQFPNMALRTFMYIYAACLGEARHARGEAASHLFIPETVGMSRGDLFEHITAYPPTKENLETLVAVFAQDWRGGFGGKSWKQIAKACQMYFTVPADVFLDHVIDLQHNNGTVFSKDESQYSLEFKIKYYGSFQYFLDAKFKYDILEQNFCDEMRVSRPVRKFLDRYEVLFRSEHTHWITAWLKPLTDYVVEWGNDLLHLVEKWRSWTDCSRTNEPTARYALVLAGIDDISYESMTCSEFEKEVKECIKEAKEICAKFPDIQKEIVQKGHNFLRGNLVYCWLEKAEKTYTVIPCKVKNVLDKTEIQFPIPFFGIGEQTEYGFKLTDYIPHTDEHGQSKGYDGSDGYKDATLTYDAPKLKFTTYNTVFWYSNKKLETIIE